MASIDRPSFSQAASRKWSKRGGSACISPLGVCLVVRRAALCLPLLPDCSYPALPCAGPGHAGPGHAGLVLVR
eukprot:5519802-Heterocapsa_arctica.AAC.1